MNIQGFSIIATYACNLSCDHCFFGKAESVEYLSAEMLAANLDSFASEVQWIHFTGGEPLLDSDRFFPVLSVVSSRHAGNIGVATNGYWAGTPAKARSMVDRLLSGGVDGISISVDAFHQPGVTLETATNAAAAIADAGIAEHCWIVTSLLPVDVEAAEETNTRSQLMAGMVSRASGIPVATAEVRPIGRGSEADRTGREMPVPDGPCTELACCLGETGPFDPQMLWIDPFGNVQICYGITIGSLQKNSLTDILEKYDPHTDEILDLLSRQGPVGLYHKAQELGHFADETFFRDECDLCFRSRRALRHLHPGTLSPNVAY